MEETAEKKDSDGIINEENFNKAPLKILWVLKETNGNFDIKNTFSPGFDFDFRIKMIREKNKAKEPDKRKPSRIKNTFGLVAKVSHVLLSGKGMEGFCEDFKKLSPVMSSIAIMNVNKKTGKSVSSLKKLRKIAKENGKELSLQFKSIDPEIIIFGTTFDLMKKILNLSQCRKENTEMIFHGKKKVCYFSDKVFIAAFHPNVKEKSLTHKAYAKEILTVVEKWQELKTSGKLDAYEDPE